MDKDIRKLISEAFDELYSEMMNEAPGTLRKNAIDDADVASIIDRAKSSGRPAPKFDTAHKPSAENFKKIINALAQDYKETRNPNSKAAIQGSYSPEGWVAQSALGPYSREGEADLAVSEAYEQVLLNNFDDLIDSFKPGDNFGGMVMNSLKNRVHNYFVKGVGRGGAGEASTGAARMDAKIDDDSGTTYGDKLASTAFDADAEEREMGRASETEKQWQIIRFVLDSIEEEFDVENPKVMKNVETFKMLMQGMKPEEIVAENPDWYAGDTDELKAKNVSATYNNFTNSTKFKAIEEYVNDRFGTELNFNRIKLPGIVQTYAQDPTFDDSYRKERVRVSTPAMDAAKEEVDKRLKAVGFKWNDWTTDAKKQKVISKLAAQGKHDELEAIMKADEKYENIKDRETKAGKYDAPVAEIPTPEEEAEWRAEKERRRGAEELNESVVDKLMERVLRRLGK